MYLISVGDIGALQPKAGALANCNMFLSGADHGALILLLV